MYDSKKLEILPHEERNRNLLIYGMRGKDEGTLRNALIGVVVLPSLETKDVNNYKRDVLEKVNGSLK